MKGVNQLVSGGVAFTREVIGLMFLSLFRELPDFEEHPPTFEPNLAESWEFSDDRLLLTVRLRPGVVWSDGAPVTAEDVRWTWQAQTDPRVGWVYGDGMEHVRDVEIVDPLTLRFHFERAYASQLADINGGRILPKHVWSELPFEEWAESEEWFQSHLVVNGPFKLTSWRRLEEMVLERNESYYRADEGLPRLDRVVFRVIPDRSIQVTQLLRGEIDFMPRVDMVDLPRLEQAEEARLLPYWHRLYTYISWNGSNPLFSQPEVRRALTLAIDRQTIIDTLRPGRAKIASSPIISSAWAHPDDLEPWPFDPGTAREILASHGWEPDEDGVLERDGQPFSFALATNAASRSWGAIATMVQEQLGAIGIEVIVHPMEFNTMIAKMGDHDYDAAIGAFGIDTSLDLHSMFHSDSIDNGYNFSGYSDPRVDELIESARQQVEAFDAGPMLIEIQEILHRDQPFTFLWEPQRLSAARANLQEVRPNSVSTYQNLDHWWLAE